MEMREEASKEKERFNPNPLLISLSIPSKSTFSFLGRKEEKEIDLISLLMAFRFPFASRSSFFQILSTFRESQNKGKREIFYYDFFSYYYFPWVLWGSFFS
jgi:hypothetical protein